MIRVLITGANGFIGTVLCQQLLADGFLVRGAFRTAQVAESFPHAVEKVIVGDIKKRTNWDEALQAVNVVIHLAARVHVMHETESDPLTAFETVNTAGTLNLAEQAANQGVNRFLFLSTIKVNGEQTEQAYSAYDKVHPTGPYALSKWQAESGLQAIQENNTLQVVIIRPPLVYGPQVKGNFLRLLKLIKKGLPLPFASIKNKRSMVGVTNLCDLIKTCITHSRAGGEVFLVSDGRDLSTPELMLLMGDGLQKSTKLLPFPVAGLYWIAGLFGKRQDIDRLCGSLTVDIKKNQDVLGWVPPCSVEDEIRKTISSIAMKNAY